MLKAGPTTDLSMRDETNQPSYSLNAQMRDQHGNSESFTLNVFPPEEFAENEWECQFECASLGLEKGTKVRGVDSEQSFALALSLILQILEGENKYLVHEDGCIISLPIDHVAATIGAWAHLRKTKMRRRQTLPEHKFPKGGFRLVARTTTTSGRMSHFKLTISRPYRGSMGCWSCFLECQSLGFAGHRVRGNSPKEAVAFALWLVGSGLEREELELVGIDAKSISLPISWDLDIPQGFN